MPSPPLVVAGGIPGRCPVVADYDGDGKADQAVYRPETGEWFIRYSVAGMTTSRGDALRAATSQCPRSIESRSPQRRDLLPPEAWQLTGAPRYSLSRAMTLPDEYERQERWRRWDTALARVPLARGQRVLDLGCGADRDGDARAGRRRRHRCRSRRHPLARARQRHPGLRFENEDIGALEPTTFGRVDGIWGSFVAAYFADATRSSRGGGDASSTAAGSRSSRSMTCSGTSPGRARSPTTSRYTRRRAGRRLRLRARPQALRRRCAPRA